MILPLFKHSGDVILDFEKFLYNDGDFSFTQSRSLVFTGSCIQNVSYETTALIEVSLLEKSRKLKNSKVEKYKWSDFSIEIGNDLFRSKYSFNGAFSNIK